MKTKIIFIDGADGSGKTSLIKRLISGFDGLPNRYANCLIELKFNKATGGLLRINDETHFEIMKALLVHLPKDKVWIIDRCYLSNMVYDKVLREDDALPSLEFRDWCKDNLDSIEIVLDRDEVTEDYEDDLIAMNKEVMNWVIKEYRQYTEMPKYLNRKDGRILVNDDVYKEVYDMAREMISEMWNENRGQQHNWSYGADGDYQ